MEDRILEIIRKSNSKEELSNNFAILFDELSKQGVTYNDFINKIILLLKNEGLLYKEISQIIGMGTKAISVRLEKIEGKPKSNRTKANYDTIRNDLEQGLTRKQIAEKHEMAYSTVNTKIKKMKEQGIEIPEAKKQKEIQEFVYNLMKNGLTFPEIHQICNEKGIKIPKELKQNLKKEYIYNLRNEGLTFREISERGKEDGIEFSYETARKNYLEINAIEKQLAKSILNLIKTRHATIEQIQLIADYYNIDLNKILSFLEIKEGIIIPKEEREFKTKISKGEKDEQIIEFVKQGLTQNEIGNRFDVSGKTICRRIKKIEKQERIVFPRQKAGRKRNSIKNEQTEEQER